MHINFKGTSLMVHNIRWKWRLAWAAGVLALASGRAVAAEPPKVDERALIEKLSSDAPAAEKAMTCKKLAVYGSKDAVPALVPLLTDSHLCSWARIALEAIPGAEADAALLDATGKVQGRLLVGVINSLGVRRYAGAATVLTAKLHDADPDVASAAAVALGLIGAPASLKAVENSPVAVRSAVAEGSIAAAEKLMREEKLPEAVKLYDAVRTADLPKQRIIEATRGAILARKSKGVPLLVEQLHSPDKAMFYLGLSTARELPGRDVSDALAKEITRATPERAALLMLVLKDREDQVASPAVLETAKNGAKPLRLAALGVLRRAGDISSVPGLLEIAADADADVAQAAKTALAELPDKKVDADIAERLNRNDTDGESGAKLRILLDVAGQRRVSASEAMLKAADSSDAATRAAALTALGATISLDKLPLLIARAGADGRAEDAATAKLALRVAAVRMADREACAEKLIAAMAHAPLATRAALLDVLGSVGGTKALIALGAAGKDKDPELQEVATRSLGAWMSVDAAPVLLDLAKTAPEEKYRTRALRGGIRIARQFTMPDRQRAELCRTALAASSRPAEQKLVLEVLARYPHVDTLAVALEATQTAAIKDEASRVAAAIAEKVAGKGMDPKQLLALLQSPVKLEIVKAEYGAGKNQKDVTELLRKQVSDRALVGLPSPSYNDSFGGDPAPGTLKQLKVQYKINGTPGEAAFAENAVIVLPMPK